MKLTDDVRVRDLLHMIEKKYPKGSAKVDPDFVREMVMRLEPWVVRTPSGIERIQDIYRRANAKRGITAMNLYSEIRSLLSCLDAETISHTPDSSIARLERQLHDLRNIVTSPLDIDRKFRDLQEQLESIREDVDGSRAAPVGQTGGYATEVPFVAQEGIHHYAISAGLRQCVVRRNQASMHRMPLRAIARRRGQPILIDYG